MKNNMNGLKHFLLAIQFFTRIPITGRLAAWVGYSHEMLQKSAAHFPGVGLLVGLWAACVYGGISLLLPLTVSTSWVAAVCSVVATVMLTGAFHEDGLADVADGLGGVVERARALEIMKDSRIGSYGAVALGLALMLKFSLLAVLGEIDGGLTCMALVFAHVVSRTFPLLMIRFWPHVGDAAGAKSKVLADHIGLAGLIVAGLWLFLSLALMASLQVWLGSEMWLLQLSQQAVAGLLGGAMAFTYMWRLGQRRLQGYTGDFLGATQQVCELGIYLGIVVSLH